MPTPRHLREAPITEAIVDFRVRARAAFAPKDFDRIKPEVSKQFPRLDESRSGKVTFQLSPVGATPPVIEDLGFQGLVFRSADDKTLVQFRTDGFTLNRLRPYTSWNEIFPIALGLWNLYSSVARPDAVIRLATRYVNQIALPPDLRDFDDYLRAAPRIPPEIPQYMTAFFARTTVHDPERDLAAHIVQALETDAANRKVTLILDIDAYCEGSWQADDPEIEAKFRELHDFKNLIFFNTVTDETLRQFE